MRILLTIISLLVSLNMDARVYTGLEVFLAKHINLVKNKRVGLVTNPTGVNANKVSTVDLLRRYPQIKLTALFAPEHGIRGDIKAGENVPGGRDPISGLPVYTLYGANGHRPSKAALEKIDVLIYDIQDVGSRAYTYIWHLAECMSAAAETGKTVIVFDRPNPYGAVVLDGPVTEHQFLSFIGLYPIPRVYGMTVGELARYLNKEEKINCRLYIVPMMNYRRGMYWEQTGLPWIPPSPNIPSPQSAYCFAATGTIGEIGCMNIGIGHTAPFQTIAAPWINADHASASLNKLRLPGVKFIPVHYKPSGGAYANNYVHGVRLDVVSPPKFKPATTEVAILCYLRKNYPGHFKWVPDGKTRRLASFDKAMGTSSVRNCIDAGWDYKNITALWEKEIQNFRLKQKKYLIYK